MTPDDATPPPEIEYDDFAAFSDLVPSESIAIHGMRIVTLLDDDGRQWIQWAYAGNPSIDEVIAMLSRMSFLAQMAEFVESSRQMDEDDPE